MSKITRCWECGGFIVQPAFQGDGAYPVEPMCSCPKVLPADRLSRRADPVTESPSYISAMRECGRGR